MTVGERRSFRLVLVWLVLAVVGACGRSPGEGDAATTPPGWSTIDFGDVVTLSVPAGAVDQNVTPVDSMFRVFLGDGFELTLEYGRFVQRIDQPAGTVWDRDVDGRRGTESFTRTGPDPARPVVRALEVVNDDGTLVVRMSCTEESTCRQADQVFDSIRLRPR